MAGILPFDLFGRWEHPDNAALSGPPSSRKEDCARHREGLTQDELLKVDNAFRNHPGEHPKRATVDVYWRRWIEQEEDPDGRTRKAK
jgi:hypothetical protein